jgi:hypothetical protein
MDGAGTLISKDGGRWTGTFKAGEKVTGEKWDSMGRKEN